MKLNRCTCWKMKTSKYEKKKSKSKCSKFFGVLLTLVFLIVFAFYAYQLLMKYFQYGTKTVVNVGAYEIIRPPVVTICFQDHFRNCSSSSECPENLRNAKNFFQNVSNFGETFESFSFHDFNQIKDDKIDKYLTCGKNISRTSNQITFRTPTDLSRFKIGNDVCYHIDVNYFLGNFSFGNYPSNYYNQQQILASSSQVMFEIAIKKNIKSKYRIELSESSIYQGIKTFPLITSNYHSVNESITINYSKQVFNYLPPPYMTNCNHYPMVNISNQETCINLCANKIHIAKYGKLKFWSPIEDSTFPNLLEIETEHREVPQECLKKCSKPDCMKFNYNLNTETKYSSNGSKVVVKFQSSPTIFYRTVPEITFLEFLLKMLQYLFVFSFLAIAACCKFNFR